MAAYLIAARVAPRVPVPQPARQVPSWLTEVHSSGFLYFGVEMGTGVRTRSPTFLPYVLAILVLLVPTVPATGGAAIGFAFGRALAVPLYRRASRSGAVGLRFPRWAELAVTIVVVIGAMWYAHASGP